MKIKDKDVILFQGDSITDCGRDRDDINSLGNGYVFKISKKIEEIYKLKNITIINKGISGNRTVDLTNRWEEDTLDLNPNIVSIMIGINDTWRAFDNNDITSIEAFEKHYRDILTRIKENGVREIVLMEPFLLPYPEDRRQWRYDLDPKIHVTRKLAKEFNCHLVPLDGILNSIFVKNDERYLSEDGVHPSDVGHEIIAKLWMEYTKIIES